MFNFDRNPAAIRARIRESRDAIDVLKRKIAKAPSGANTQHAERKIRELEFRIEDDKLILKAATLRTKPRQLRNLKPRSRKQKLTPAQLQTRKSQDHSRFFEKAGLSERQRQCLSLRVDHGLSNADIARQLDLSRKTVNDTLAAADAKMERFGLPLKGRRTPQHPTT